MLVLRVALHAKSEIALHSCGSYTFKIRNFCCDLQERSTQAEAGQTETEMTGDRPPPCPDERQSGDR
jgi:hypothetical protein